MPTDLPYAADAEVSLSYDELAVSLCLQDVLAGFSQLHLILTCHVMVQVLQLQYQKEGESGHITTQTKFNYAWGLVKSPQREQQVHGVRLLQGWSFKFCTIPSGQIADTF
jgi:fission 1 protein